MELGEGVGDTVGATVQAGNVDLFRGATGKQMHDVNTPRLPDTLDPADTLLQAQRCPRLLEIDYQTASLLQIETFAGGIRCEQEWAIADCEATQALPALSRGEPAVQCGRPEVYQFRREVNQRVAIFGKYDGRLMRTA
jgi:hypothetical protein